MCESYYHSMLDYIQKKNFLTLNLINRNKYIVSCFLSIDETTNTTLQINVCYRHDKKFSVSAQKDIITPDDIKNLLELIEKQAFCVNENCRTTIYDNKDMVGDVCFKCAFYEDYRKTLTDSDCSICLENNSIKSIELNCGHIFHTYCLLKACQRSCADHYHLKCPLCRVEIILDLYLHQMNTCD